MKKDRVIFRRFPEGDIIALFPEMPESNGMINSYQHIGQHGAASRQLIKELSRVMPKNYESLKQELIKIGYNL